MTHEADMTDHAQRVHRDCWEQIPWIANEALDARTYASLEPHLRTCASCREELALQERTRALMRRDDAVMLAPQSGWQKLVQRIDAQDAGAEKPTDVPTPPAPPRHGARAVGWRRWPAIAAGLQAIALAAVLTAQYTGREQGFAAPRFETLTTNTPIGSSGPVIRLVFHAEIALQDMNALLHTVNGQIVAGPSEAGVYTIALKGDGHAVQDIDAALSRLRADPRVLFAEAAVARSAQ